MRKRKPKFKLKEINILRQAFRKSKEWKEFREDLLEEQKKDPITEGKLAKTAHCHHRKITNDIDEYTDISDSSDFVMLNSQTHKFLHWAYDYYKKDPEFLDRLKEQLDIMVEKNK